jgi:hypothetical protein
MYKKIKKRYSCVVILGWSNYLKNQDVLKHLSKNLNNYIGKFKWSNGRMNDRTGEKTRPEVRARFIFLAWQPSIECPPGTKNKDGANICLKSQRMHNAQTVESKCPTAHKYVRLTKYSCMTQTRMAADHPYVCSSTASINSFTICAWYVCWLQSRPIYKKKRSAMVFGSTPLASGCCSINNITTCIMPDDI